MVDEKKGARNDIATGVFAVLLIISFIFGGVILYVSYWNTHRIESRIFERTAASYSDALSQFRQFYTSEIVGRIHSNDVNITHDYKNLDNAIPVPATMTNDLAYQLNNKSNDVKISIVSEYPFSFRLPRILTEFEQNAFEEFRRTSASSYSAVYDENGQYVFRYAAPMLMTEGCVACHNNHPNSTKTDWRYGDVRGLQVVEIYGSDLMVENKLGFAYIFASVVAFFLLSTSIIIWLITRHKRVEAEARGSLQASKAELEKSNKSLQMLAITDFLTGLYNRQRLDEILRQEVNRANRYKSPLGFAIFDIDHFKRVNDTYGHDIGDQVLIELAELVKSRIRDTDTVGRWGGEEFILICSETDREGMQHFTESLRKAISETEFSVVGDLSASFGITVYVEGESIQEMVVRADTALYDAKEQGRNRVIFL